MRCSYDDAIIDLDKRQMYHTRSTGVIYMMRGTKITRRAIYNILYKIKQRKIELIEEAKTINHKTLIY